MPKNAHRQTDYSEDVGYDSLNPMNGEGAEVAPRNRAADSLSPCGQRKNGSEFLIEGYRGLLEAAPDAMVIVNQRGEIMLLNVQAEKQFGYGRDELVGQEVKKIIPEGFGERLIADGNRTAAEALAQQIGTGIELYGRRRDGSEFPIEIMLSPLESAEGILVAAAIRDISVRKDREKHLAQMEGRYRGLLEAAPDAMVVVNQGGEIVLLNVQAEKQFGYRRDELVGQKVKNIIPQGFAERLIADGTRSAADALAQQIGTGIELSGRRRDGSEFPIEIMLSPLESAEGILVTAAIRDISLRKKAERHLAQMESRRQLVEDALRESEERYRMLLDGVQDYAIFMMDPRGQVVSWNAGAERIKGYTADQIIGHSFSCFFPPEDIERGRPEEVLRITAASGRHEEQGMRVRKDGSQFLASVTFTALHDPAGNLRGFSEISHDLRESKESEAKYRGLLEAAPDAMVVVNQRGEITLLNVQAEKQFGYRRDELVGQKVKNIIPEGFAERLIADSLRSAEDALAQQIGTGIELNGKRKDGSEFPIEIMLSPLESAEGILVTAAIRDITTRKKAEAQMIHASEHDFLTGLPNRMLLNDRVNQAIRLSERYRRKLAVLFLDLDGFKHINDSLGHPAGDKLLQSVAKRLVDCVRGSDTVSRQGGDEFVVLLLEQEHLEDAAMTVRRMLQAVAEAHSIDQHDLHVTSCVGVSVYPNDGLDAETLIKNADTAMYQAKENGPQTYQFFKSAMNVRAVERQGIEESLRRALERKEFALHYQPKINLRTGETAGAEALIRWTHPTRGRVSPAQFIPVAEDCGLILPIGNWVLREACQQARAWLDAGLPLGTMAVNISAMQLRDKNFLEGVFAILKDTGLDPRSLELELTESILMKHAESTASILKSLRSSGVQLAVDDFGTGYSSLSYLRKFPIDALKIDQSFVRQITTIPDETIIVEAVISMGRSLKLRVVAEGVETQEQLAFLQAHQCDEAQGYYFSRPLLPHQFANMLENQLAGSREVRFWTSV
ncbi:MAG TPA: PAS domain S-box protein [Candidatus Acidoferrum sp.]|nr:PAS domain S-box protein [Candidatus Acidoferrum sp.]